MVGNRHGSRGLRRSRISPTPSTRSWRDWGTRQRSSSLSGDLGVHQQVAKSLLAHVQSGDKIKTLPDGTPKVGAFTSKTVKLAGPFFDSVKVNGVPAVAGRAASCIHRLGDASRTIFALDQAWPISVQIPDEDTIAEKVQWHRTEVAQLDKVLELGDQLERGALLVPREQAPDTRLEQPRRHSPLCIARRSCCGCRQCGNGNVPIGQR